MLVDEDTIRQYKADLGDEIEPQIVELIERADKGAKALAKQESQLRAKVSELHFPGRVILLLK